MQISPAPVTAGKLVHRVRRRVGRGSDKQDANRADNDVHGVNHHGKEDEGHSGQQIGLTGVGEGGHRHTVSQAKNTKKLNKS